LRCAEREDANSDQNHYQPDRDCRCHGDWEETAIRRWSYRRYAAYRGTCSGVGILGEHMIISITTCENDVAFFATADARSEFAFDAD
jgi:hypothetical protein